MNDLDTYPFGSRMTLREHIETTLTVYRATLTKRVQAHEEGELWIGHRIEPSGTPSAVTVHWVPARYCEVCGRGDVPLDSPGHPPVALGNEQTGVS